MSASPIKTATRNVSSMMGGLNDKLKQYDQPITWIISYIAVIALLIILLPTLTINTTISSGNYIAATLIALVLYFLQQTQLLNKVTNVLTSTVSSYPTAVKVSNHVVYVLFLWGIVLTSFAISKHLDKEYKEREHRLTM